jgi:hypothetical protein
VCSPIDAATRRLQNERTASRIAAYAKRVLEAAAREQRSGIIRVSRVRTALRGGLLPLGQNFEQ